MEISVVIPTYNQAPLLRACLQALAEQTLPAGTYEVLVVDDGSTDDTAAVVESFGAPIGLLRLPANQGRSAARNAGIRAAAGRMVVFLDSDVLVRRDFLWWHARTHERHGPGTLSRGPVVLIPAPAAVPTARVPWFLASPALLDTANAGVERAALLRAGLFDERFPGYGWEDVDLGFRLRRIGIRRVFCRQAAAFHIEPPVGPEALPALLHKEEERAKSAVYFYRQHPGLEARILIQATAVHRFLYWVQSGFGLPSPQALAAAAAGLRRAGLPGLAYLVMRGTLNRHYISTLAAEFPRHAAVA